MINHIDYYFEPSNWVIPEYVYFNDFKVKNSGLRIRANFLCPNSRKYGSWEYEIWDQLGILLDNNTFYPIAVNTENLFQVIQYTGITPDGFLEGRFRLMEEKGKIYPRYKLIPEDCREAEWKEEISKVYLDPSVKFTSKLIPGHLYISKYKNLFLCLGVDLLCYSSHTWSIGIETTPRKAKFILPLSPYIKERLDATSPKTMKDFMKKVFEHFRKDNPYRLLGNMYSDRYSGKDLGEVVKPGNILNYISSDNVGLFPRDLLLCNEIWKTNGIVNEYLIKLVNNNLSLILSAKNISNSTKRLMYDLGI